MDLNHGISVSAVLLRNAGRGRERNASGGVWDLEIPLGFLLAPDTGNIPTNLFIDDMAKNEGKHRLISLMSMSLMSIYMISLIYYSIKHIPGDSSLDLEWSSSWRSRDPWNLKGARFHHPKQFTKNVYMDLPRATRIPNEKDGITGGSTSTKNRPPATGRRTMKTKSWVWWVSIESFLPSSWGALHAWMFGVVYTPFLWVQIAPLENVKMLH